MRYIYPVKLSRDADGNYLATSRDIPEALTEGHTRSEALAAMSDALGAALAGYSIEGKSIPTPTNPKRNEYQVPVAPLVAAKIALRNAMADKGLSNVSLAGLIGLSESAVRRLVNPDHASKLEGVIKALSATGHQIVVEDIETV
jgi:antitoxin HicB